MQVQSTLPSESAPVQTLTPEKRDAKEISQVDCEASSEPEKIVLDGLKGCVIVAAAACTLFVYLGVIYSWGIMQLNLVEMTGASLTTLMFVGSLASSCMVSISIFSGIAVRKLGYQKTAFLGAFLMGLGEFLASWATQHIGALFAFHSLVFGVGGGLSIFACATGSLRWFKKYKALAIGTVYGGGGLGAAVMSIVTNILAKQVGVAWTFRIMAFMLWGICLPAAYLIQVPAGTEDTNLGLQWYRFKEAKFLIFLVGTSLSCFALFVPPYFIPLFAQSMGYSRQISIITLAAWNLASMVGRIGAGYMSDLLLGPINSLVLCLLLVSLSSFIIWPLSFTIGIFAIFLVLNGIGCGAFFSLVPPALGTVFGNENTFGIIPIVWMCWFFGFFFGTPIASGLYTLSSGSGDGVERFRPAAYYAGAVSMVGIMFVIAIRWTHTRKLFIKI